MQLNLKWTGKIILFAAAFIMLNSGYLFASESVDEKSGGFYGAIKEVDCAQSELKANNLIGDKKGSLSVFVIGKDVKFRGVKGCQELVPNGRVHIRYTEKEGKKTITSLHYRPAGQRSAKQASTAPRAKASVGWVNSVDCANGTLVIENIENRTRTESFAFSKETIIETDGGKGCEGLKKGYVVSFVYNEKDGGKVILKLKVSAKDDK